MHGGVSPGAPKNNRHALKHGHFAADTIARRQNLAALLKRIKVLMR